MTKGMFDEILENVGEPYTGGSKGFKYGTHEVVIGTVTSAQKDLQSAKNADVIEVESYDINDPERIGKSTLYFHTEGGAKMSVTKILGMIVHNVGEDKKDKVRELGKKLFAGIESPSKARDVAAKLMTEKFMVNGKEYKAFFFADPRGKYSTTNYGDLWHYNYEDPDRDDKEEKAANEAMLEEGEEIDTSDMPDLSEL